MNLQTLTTKKKAYLEIGLGILLLGTGPMFVKFVRAGGVQVAFYRLLFAGILLALPAWFDRIKGSTQAVGGKKYLWVLSGACLFAVNIALWCSALNFTTASIVTLLDNTAPIWVGLFSWLVLHEKQNGYYWLGLCLAIIGSFLLVAQNVPGQGSSQGVGILLSVASGISYAGYILVTQRARQFVSSIQYSWMVSAVGSVLLFIIGTATGALRESLSFESYLLIFLMALSSQVFGWYLVNEALGKLPAAGASVSLVGQPLVTTILAVFILKEVPTMMQLIGGIICLIGIIAAQWSQQTDKKGQ